MKTFVIGWANLYDCEIKLEKVKAEDEISALVKFLRLDEDPDFKKSKWSVKRIQDYAINGDETISIMEI